MLFYHLRTSCSPYFLLFIYQWLHALLTSYYLSTHHHMLSLLLWMPCPLPFTPPPLRPIKPEVEKSRRRQTRNKTILPLLLQLSRQNSWQSVFCLGVFRVSVLSGSVQGQCSVWECSQSVFFLWAFPVFHHGSEHSRCGCHGSVLSAGPGDRFVGSTEVQGYGEEKYGRQDRDNLTGRQEYRPACGNIHHDW